MNCGRRVGDKGNKQRVWLALDVQTREIVGVHIGDCSAESALLVVAVTAPGVPPMCGDLQRFLVNLCGCLTQQTAGVQWAHKQEKLAILNASIALYVSACHV